MTTIALRPYQLEAIEAAEKVLAQGHHPVLALPTGAGKSLVLAEIARRHDGRVLVATHRQELLQQNIRALAQLSGLESAGIYSAGLERREAEARVVFGGIQSIYRHMERLQAWRPFSLVIVDECHLVPPKSANGAMYAQVFAACPEAPRVGLSATPYRLEGGQVWGESDSWFDVLAYEVGIRALIPDYLAPLRGILTAHNVDVAGVRTRQGDYVLSDLSQKACDQDLVEGALDELCQLAQARRSWLLFCVDVAHTRLVTERLQARGIACDLITGDTPKDQRADILGRFDRGELRALVNCQVATTGFNLPDVDAIAMLRPSQSKSLIVQMIGRGSRQAPGKEDCLIVDFAGNLDRHAPLHEIPSIESSPAREARDARERQKRQEAAERLKQYQHSTKASTRDPFGEDQPVGLVRGVLKAIYELQPSKKYPGKQNLVVSYLLDGQPKWVRQWVTLEYEGGAQWYARQWFARRGVSMPSTAAEALSQAHQGRYPTPQGVVLLPEGKYMRIVLEHFGSIQDVRSYDDDTEDAYAHADD